MIKCVSDLVPGDEVALGLERGVIVAARDYAHGLAVVLDIGAAALLAWDAVVYVYRNLDEQARQAEWARQAAAEAQAAQSARERQARAAREREQEARWKRQQAAQYGEAAPTLRFVEGSRPGELVAVYPGRRGYPRR